MSTDPLYYDLVAAILLSGNIQARKVGNDSFEGIEVRGEDGIRIIWGNSLGHWGWTSVLIDGSTHEDLTDLPADARAEDVAALIAMTHYEVP